MKKPYLFLAIALSVISARAAEMGTLHSEARIFLTDVTSDIVPSEARSDIESVTFERLSIHTFAELKAHSHETN